MSMSVLQHAPSRASGEAWQDQDELTTLEQAVLSRFVQKGAAFLYDHNHLWHRRIGIVGDLLEVGTSSKYELVLVATGRATAGLCADCSDSPNLKDGDFFPLKFRYSCGFDVPIDDLKRKQKILYLQECWRRLAHSLTNP